MRPLFQQRESAKQEETEEQRERPLVEKLRICALESACPDLSPSFPSLFPNLNLSISMISQDSLSLTDRHDLSLYIRIYMYIFPSISDDSYPARVWATNCFPFPKAKHAFIFAVNYSAAATLWAFGMSTLGLLLIKPNNQRIIFHKSLWWVLWSHIYLCNQMSLNLFSHWLTVIRLEKSEIFR